MTLDTSAKTITLTNFQPGNYETGFLDISGITGDSITSLATLSYAGFYDPSFYNEPITYGGTPVPLLSFTSNSIRIVFTTYAQSPPQFTYSGSGQAVFSYNSTPGVPEPASAAMVGIGLPLLIFVRRWRTR